MATAIKHNAFAEDVYEGVHDLGSDTLKVMLVNELPTAADGQKSDLIEISAGNGYIAGGDTVTITASSQTSGTYKLVGNDVTFTASGGQIGPFRAAVIYNDTDTNDKLVVSWDNGSSITLEDGESFTVDLSATNGILQHS